MAKVTFDKEGFYKACCVHGNYYIHLTDGNIYIYNSTFQIIQAKKIEKYITIPMHFQKPQLEITIFRNIIKIDCYKFQKKKIKKENDIETYLRIKKIT